MSQPDQDPVKKYLEARQKYWKAEARMSGCLMWMYGLAGLFMLIAVGAVLYALFDVVGILVTLALGAAAVAFIRWMS